MFRTSQTGDASAVGTTRSEISIYPRWPRPRHSVVPGPAVCAPTASRPGPRARRTGSRAGGGADWDRARWELGSQGDKKCIDLGSSRKKEASSSRSGGLATIGNHVLLRRASLPKAAPSLFLPPWRGVPRPLPALRSPRPPRCRVCVGDGAGDLARLQ